MRRGHRLQSLGRALEPGLVLDTLNAALKPHGLWFPVDVSTSAQATIGGMAGNNSCGSRSIRYGNMVHNVAAIDALLADGTEVARAVGCEPEMEIERRRQAEAEVRKLNDELEDRVSRWGYSLKQPVLLTPIEAAG